MKEGGDELSPSRQLGYDLQGVQDDLPSHAQRPAEEFEVEVQGEQKEEARANETDVGGDQTFSSVRQLR